MGRPADLTLGRNGAAWSRRSLTCLAYGRRWQPLPCLILSRGRRVEEEWAEAVLEVQQEAALAGGQAVPGATVAVEQAVAQVAERAVAPEVVEEQRAVVPATVAAPRAREEAQAAPAGAIPTPVAPT